MILKNLFILVFVALTYSASAQQDEMKKSQGKDQSQKEIRPEMTDSLNFQFVVDQGKKKVISLKAGFNNPSGFDLTIQDGNKSTTIKSLFEFITRDHIRLQIHSNQNSDAGNIADGIEITILKSRD